MFFLKIVSLNVCGFISDIYITDCRKLTKDLGLDLICETKLESSLIDDLMSYNKLKLFLNEDSIHNFDISTNGSIWIKWNSSSISFIALQSHAQFIHDLITLSSSIKFFITFVYADNSASNRKVL